MIILLTIIILALSTEVFTVVFLNGYLRDARFAKIMVSALTVAIINAVLAGLGLLIGTEINKLLDSFADIVSTAILLVVGLKILLKSTKSKLHEMSWELTSFKVLTGFSFATGINSFLAGFALAGAASPLSESVTLFFAIYLVMVTAGVLFGKLNNNLSLAVRTSFAGGVVLMAIALFSFFYKTGN